MSQLHGITNSLNQDLFNALADPTRRAIIELLATNGQMSATDIYGNFDMSDPAVSQHLKVLRKADLLQMKKSAQKHFFRLNSKTLQGLADWVKETTEHWDEQFDKLDSLLEAETQKTKKRR